MNKDIVYVYNIDSGCKLFVLFCFLQVCEIIISSNNVGKNVVGIIVEFIQFEGGKNFVKKCICDYFLSWFKIFVKEEYYIVILKLFFYNNFSRG